MTNRHLFRNIAIRTACVVLLATAVQNAEAQYSQTERRQLKNANNLYDAGQYDKALPIYIQLDSVIDDINLRYKIGLCYLKSEKNDANKAVEYLENVSVSAGTLISNDVIWNLGDAYHLGYRFEDAIKEYNTYITKTAKSNNADLNKLNHCKRMIAICNNAILITSQPYKVDIEPIVKTFSVAFLSRDSVC